MISLDRPSEDIYWFSGAVTYQLANVLFILLLAVLVRLYFAQSTIEKCLLLTASGLLVLFVVGSNETIIIPTTFVLASLLWLSLFKDEKHIRSL